MPKKKKPTPEQIRDARRLRREWERAKGELHLTQSKLADLMGFKGASAVNQYLQGIIPLSNEALLRFAHHLQFDPRNVRPDIYKELELSERDVPQDLAELSALYQSMVLEDRELLLETARRFAKRQRQEGDTSDS